MHQFERIYQLHSILVSRRTPISREALADRLEISRSTLTRLISMYRNNLCAPLDNVPSGYVLNRDRDGGRWELP